MQFVVWVDAVCCLVWGGYSMSVYWHRDRYVVSSEFSQTLTFSLVFVLSHISWFCFMDFSFVFILSVRLAFFFLAHTILFLTYQSQSCFCLIDFCFYLINLIWFVSQDLSFLIDWPISDVFVTWLTVFYLSNQLESCVFVWSHTLLRRSLKWRCTSFLVFSRAESITARPGAQDSRSPVSEQPVRQQGSSAGEGIQGEIRGYPQTAGEELPCCCTNSRSVVPVDAPWTKCWTSYSPCSVALAMMSAHRLVYCQ